VARCGPGGPREAPLAQELEHVGLSPGLTGKYGPHTRGGRVHVDALELRALDPTDPFPAALPDAGGERPEIAGGDDVDRRAHEGGLDDAPLNQGLSQVLAPKAVQAAPQRDVSGRRVLRLETRHLLDGPGQRQRRSLEQELAREQRTVQFAGRERALARELLRARLLRLPTRLTPPVSPRTSRASAVRAGTAR
jgi:hypothetical protein